MDKFQKNSKVAQFSIHKINDYLYIFYSSAVCKRDFINTKLNIFILKKFKKLKTLRTLRMS